MLDHHLQREIVFRLALSPDGVRFSELKPDTLDNKLFTYHLKKVISAKLVEKGSEGLYMLTPEGRRLGVRVLYSQQAMVDRAESVLFLVVRRAEDGAWLMYRRKVHPLINKIGFMHATPVASEASVVTASNMLLKSTGLKADFRPLGGGFFRIFDDNDLESFTHFTLMVADDAKGQISQNDEFADYFWQKSPIFSNPDMLPNMKTLVDLYLAGEPFFVEKTLQTD